MWWSRVDDYYLYRNNQSKPTPLKVDEEWVFDIKNKFVKSCSEVQPQKLIIKPEAWSKIVYLAKNIDSEWLAYGIGKDNVIEDIYIPHQKVTGTHCEEDNGSVKEKPNNIVCWIHSHADMNVFWSSTDETTYKQYPFSMVVNKKLEYKVIQRAKTPCGKYIMLDTDIQVMYPEIDEEFKKLVQERIEKETATLWREERETIWEVKNRLQSQGYDVEDVVILTTCERCKKSTECLKITIDGEKKTLCKDCINYLLEGIQLEKEIELEGDELLTELEYYGYEVLRSTWKKKKCDECGKKKKTILVKTPTGKLRNVCRDCAENIVMYEYYEYLY